MSYTALYRKYRPFAFEEVKGQEHIVTTLKNQIKAERLSHAYLFCGTRGTGKTTVAKILAKAVNCQQPQDGSPCGECPSCRAIASGSSVNVIEIDAASNNGVDDVRQIRDEVTYPPTEGRFKVYIIDEVHMMSNPAFNALLKTLEEPPAYVIFILATTDPNRIPITILSRCQRYDFRRITAETVANRLRDLMDQEQILVEDAAIRHIAKAADGSMRDALSLLDQCIAFHMGEDLTYDHVLDVLGAVDTGIFSRLLRAVLARDVTKSICLLEEVILQGRELTQFVTDFIWYLRNLLLIKSSDQMEEVLDMSRDNIALLKEEAAMTESASIMRFIRIFSELSEQMRFATQKRVLIEIALIKLCRPAMEEEKDTLSDRVSYLEQQIEKGVFVTPQAGSGTTAQAAPAKTPPKMELPKAIPEDVRQVVKRWEAIKQEMNGLARAHLKDVFPSLGDGNKLLLVFEDDISYDYASKEGHRKEITDVIARCIGKEVEILVRKNDTGYRTDEVYPDLTKVINMNLDLEEE